MSEEEIRRRDLLRGAVTGALSLAALASLSGEARAFTDDDFDLDVRVGRPGGAERMGDEDELETSESCWESCAVSCGGSCHTCGKTCDETCGSSCPDTCRGTCVTCGGASCNASCQNACPTQRTTCGCPPPPPR